MRNLNQPFTALNVYVTLEEGRRIAKLGDMECLDWKTLEEGINDIYPSYVRIEFDTMDYTEERKPLFETLENWVVFWSGEDMRILCKAVDFA